MPGNNKKNYGNNLLLHTIKRALARVMPICFVALLFAGLVCSVANDMYAFVKSDNDVELTLEEPLTVNEISDALARKGVLKNPTVFMLYVKLKDKEAVLEEYTGDLNLNSSMSYREILSAFS